MRNPVVHLAFSRLKCLSHGNIRLWQAAPEKYCLAAEAQAFRFNPGEITDTKSKALAYETWKIIPKM